jgi:uncharacterized protein YqgV (UPF0045/DUF77 family)
MDNEMKEYVKSIEQWIRENGMMSNLYIKEEKTLKLLIKSNKRQDINEYLKRLREPGVATGKYVVIQYSINTGVRFYIGPMNTICEIHEFKDGIMIEAISTNVFYLISDLETRGFIWADYKRIFNKLNRRVIKPFGVGNAVFPTISDVLK